MNINRIFDSGKEPIDDGDTISLSREYTYDSGMTRTLVRIGNKPDASLIMLYGMPFKSKDGEMIFDQMVISEMIKHVFKLSESELGRFDMGDYMKLMNYIMDQF